MSVLALGFDATLGTCVWFYPSEDADIRAMAALALGSIFPSDKSVLKSLQTVLANVDVDDELSASAAIALGQAGTADMSFSPRLAWRQVVGDAMARFQSVHKKSAIVRPYSP